MKQSFVIAAAALALALPLPATANSFAKLSPDQDVTTLPVCEPPMAPFEVVVGGTEVKAYTDWWERLDLERRLEEGSCDCDPIGVTWEAVADKADPWLDWGELSTTWTLQDRRQLRDERRDELESALSSMRAELRDKCRAE